MTNRENFDDLLRAMEYANDLLAQYQALPHDRCRAFNKRQDAPIGFNIWQFLMKRAEEMEIELIELRGRK
jgi:hypothetical protein